MTRPGDDSAGIARSRRTRLTTAYSLLEEARRYASGEPTSVERSIAVVLASAAMETAATVVLGRTIQSAKDLRGSGISNAFDGEKAWTWRINVQHHALSPDEAECREVVEGVDRFFRAACMRVKIDPDSVSLAELIEWQGIREPTRDAELALRSADLMAAASNVALAYSRLGRAASSYLRVERTRPLSSEDLRQLMHAQAGHGFALGTFERWIADVESRLRDLAVHDLLGISPADARLLKVKFPSVWGVIGRETVEFTAGPESPSSSDVRRGLNLVVAGALRFQQIRPEFNAYQREELAAIFSAETPHEGAGR